MFLKHNCCIFTTNLKLTIMESLVKDSFINHDHINESLNQFNGYWANDYTVCDQTADKHGYDRTEFMKAVYQQAKF